jgi:hypothetical protein
MLMKPAHDRSQRIPIAKQSRAKSLEDRDLAVNAALSSGRKGSGDQGLHRDQRLRSDRQDRAAIKVYIATKHRSQRPYL